MHIKKIFAHVACADLTISGEWYSRLFGRRPDSSPMSTLHEWHHGDSTGLQLFLNADAAGKSTVTLIVADIDAERRCLLDRQLSPGQVEPGDAVRILRLTDPDDNLVVLAQPRGG